MKHICQLAFKSRRRVHFVTGWPLKELVILTGPRAACRGADLACGCPAVGESTNASQGLALSSFCSAVLINLTVFWPDPPKVLQKVFEGWLLDSNIFYFPTVMGRLWPHTLKHLIQILSEHLFHCVMHLLPYKNHLCSSCNYNIKKKKAWEVGRNRAYWMYFYMLKPCSSYRVTASFQSGQYVLIIPLALDCFQNKCLILYFNWN